jgi:hypothetical protein
LKLNAVQDFGEGDHDPGIRTGTLNMYCQPSPGEKLDWVIEWETDYNPVPSTLSVKFKKESGGGACWAPVYDAGQSYKTLTDASNKIDSTVSPLADGGYKCTLRWINRPCTTVCTYKVFDPSCSRADGQSDSTTDSKSVTVSLCLQ